MIEKRYCEKCGLEMPFITKIVGYSGYDGSPYLYAYYRCPKEHWFNTHGKKKRAIADYEVKK